MARRSSGDASGAMIAWLYGKFFCEDEADAVRYNTGVIVDTLDAQHLLARYDSAQGDQPSAGYVVIAVAELAGINPNGSRRFHFFETREALAQYLAAVDGEDAVVKLVPPSLGEG